MEEWEATTPSAGADANLSILSTISATDARLPEHPGTMGVANPFLPSPAAAWRPISATPPLLPHTHTH